MLARVGVVAFNAYREAVRARILHGLFGVAIATAAYALVVGAYASQSQMRVVSDLGAAGEVPAAGPEVRGSDPETNAAFAGRRVDDADRAGVEAPVEVGGDGAVGGHQRHPVGADQPVPQPMDGGGKTPVVLKTPLNGIFQGW